MIPTINQGNYFIFANIIDKRMTENYFIFCIGKQFEGENLPNTECMLLTFDLFLFVEITHFVFIIS